MSLCRVAVRGALGRHRLHLIPKLGHTLFGLTLFFKFTNTKQSQYFTLVAMDAAASRGQIRWNTNVLSNKGMHRILIFGFPVWPDTEYPARYQPILFSCNKRIWRKKRHLTLKKIVFLHQTQHFYKSLCGGWCIDNTTVPVRMIIFHNYTRRMHITIGDEYHVYTIPRTRNTRASTIQSLLLLISLVFLTVYGYHSLLHCVKYALVHKS